VKKPFMVLRAAGRKSGDGHLEEAGNTIASIAASGNSAKRRRVTRRSMAALAAV
jgi:hypothetical protein